MLTGFALCKAAMAVAGISAPEQSVLNVLAIMANDDAQAWPAIGGASGLCSKTKLSERAVQRSVQALAAAGHITRHERPGRGVVYTVHPRHCDAPVTVAPRQTDTPATEAATPATVAPKQPRTTNTSTEASPPPRARARKGDYHRLPEGWEPTAPLSVHLQHRIDQWPPGKAGDALDGFRAWAANAADTNGKGRKLDWEQAWQNWLRTEDERYRDRPHRHASDPTRGRTIAARDNVLARMAGG